MSDSPSSSGVCPRCGRQLPALDPQLCPACLAAVAAGQLEDPPEPASDDGHRGLSDYCLEEEIGRGGMGVVWRARQLSLNRVVAVKLLVGGPLADAKVRQRFRNEAQAAAGLRHPSIVTIYEVAADADPPYFSMALIEGSNLSVRLGEAQPTIQQAVQWMIEVADAVAHAHSRGIVHRDLKPANILIDRQDRPHLSDFGLAKALDPDLDLTLTGQVLGSVNYMAPEQAAGRSADVTSAADIYALGAVLYQLLTGRPPFLAESFGEVLRQVLNEDPIPPRRLNASVPRDLETICLRCLQKEPHRRYHSAQELADDLQRFRDKKPILARPATHVERTLKWIQRNRVVSALTALLIVAFVMTAWELHRAEDYLGRAQRVNFKYIESADRRAQQDAESRLHLGHVDETVKILAQLLHDNPTNDFVRARLFSVLSTKTFPWPATPPLVHEAEVDHGAFTPDGRFVITTTRDGFLHIWNSETAVRQAFLPHDGSRGRFALSSDGTALATLSTNGGARVWDVPDGKLRFEVRHAGPPLKSRHSENRPDVTTAVIADIDFSSDGKLLASAGSDGCVCLWRVSDGKLQGRLAHAEPQNLVRFGPDGNHIVTAGATKCIVWERSANDPKLPASRTLVPNRRLDHGRSCMSSLPPVRRST